MGHIHITKPFLIGKIRIVQSANWEQLVVHIMLWTMISLGLERVLVGSSQNHVYVMQL